MQSRSIRKTDREKLLSGLIKRAEGLEAEERVIEYVVDEDGNRRAVKEKTQYKYYPPDVSAAKVCLELEKGNANAFSGLSDEDLDREKIRLMEELKRINGGS